MEDGSKEQMTREELATELGVSIGYIYGHWNEMVERYDKIGISLRRRGRGANVEYGVKSYGDRDIRWEKRED